MASHTDSPVLALPDFTHVPMHMEEQFEEEFWGVQGEWVDGVSSIFGGYWGEFHTDFQVASGLVPCTALFRVLAVPATTTRAAPPRPHEQPRHHEPRHHVEGPLV
jgi:hypothetical protein